MEIPAVRPSIKTFALLGVWVIFLSAYFQRFPFPGFFNHFFLFALSLVIAASAAGYGSFIGIRLWSLQFTSSEKFLFSTALGFGFLSLGMALMGLLGFWTRTGAALLLIPGLWMSGRHFHEAEVWLKQRHDILLYTPLTALALTTWAVLASLLLAYAPITYYDSLVYHLALPQAYQQAQSWVALPELIYSAFPQNLEMLWLLGLLLGNDTLSNLLGWLLAMTTVFSVFMFCLRFSNRPTAWWAAALLATMPAFLLLSSGGYVDVGLALFTFLSFYALLLWRENPQRTTALLAGLLGGIAIGIKYTGALGVFAGFIILMSTDCRQSWRRNIAHGFIYVGSAYLVFLPWMLKNLFVVGNPVFPFFHEWSFLKLNPWVGEAAAGYFFHGLTEYQSRSGLQVVKLLWDIAVRGMEFGGGMDVLGDLGWAPLFALLPALWLATPLKSSTKILLAFAALFYIPWAMSRPVLRFLIPLAPVLAILAAEAWTHGIGAYSSVLWRWATRIVLGALLTSGIFLFFHTTSILGSFRVILGLQDKTSYLSSGLIRNNYYPASRFIHRLPENTLTYVIGDQRGYYYDRPVIVTPIFNRNPLTDWANRAPTPRALADILKAQEVTHLLINDTEMERVTPYRIFPFTEKGRKNWTILLEKNAKLVYRDKDCRVFEL